MDTVETPVVHVSCNRRCLREVPVLHITNTQSYQRESLIHSLISAVSLHFLARKALAVEPMSPLPCHHASCSVYGFILLYSLRGP